MKRVLAFLVLIVFLVTNAIAEEVLQMNISYMDNWPKLPTPYMTRNWNETAKQVTLLSLDANADYKYFPVSTYFERTEPTSGGYSGLGYGTHTYLRADNTMTNYGEAVAQLSAVLTAALTEGIDPRNIGGLDYVKMAQVYFSRTPDGRGFINNNAPSSDCAGSFWYTLYPTILYFHLAAMYPDDAALAQQIREVADTWLDALDYIPSWDALGVSLKNRQLVIGGHTEPEGIIGAAYALYMAYERFGEEKYLNGAMKLMNQTAAMSKNPYYEIVGSYGPYLAARMNAEKNAGLPLERMLDWVFCNGSDSARGGWGIINSRWGDYDAYGLSGSVTDTTGYAFAMNTFVTAGALAPVARYAPRYSRALGQYLTNVVNNSNMFFGDGLPANLQDDGDYVAETGLTYLVYEGVRNKGKTTPFATGDAKNQKNPTGTNFSFYSSGPLGLMSSMIIDTDVKEIQCFDLLKTDFEHEKAYPTYLMYNPFDDAKTVNVTLPDVGSGLVYDAVSGKFLTKITDSTLSVTIAPDCAVQAVVVPESAEITEKNGCVYADDVVIRYADAYVTIPELEESILIEGSFEINSVVKTEPGDAAADYELSYDGTVIAKGEGIPKTIIADTSSLKAGRGALILTVTTKGGNKLSCSYGVKLLPEGGKILMDYNGEELFKILRPKDNCGTELTEQGFKMKLRRDWACFSIPYVYLKTEDHPLLIVDVPYAWGGWGLFALIDGKQYYIQGDCAGEGEMLYDLGTLMSNWGISEGKVVIQPFITTGSGAEVIISRVKIVEE